MKALSVPAWGTMLLVTTLAACAQPAAREVVGESSSASGGSTDPTPARVLETASVQDGEQFPVVHVYKTPTCGCCGDWVTHVENAGFETDVRDLPNVTPIRQRAGVPQHLGSCHTTLVGDYVVEGHVPADVIRRMLREKPDIAGIAVPGMPMGSPGMEGPFSERYDIIAFRKDGSQYVYDTR
jgi:hypothetical protein